MLHWFAVVLTPSSMTTLLTHRLGPRRAGVLFGLCLLSGPLAAQPTVASNSALELKQLSLEQLLDIEVTSVSKRPEKLLEAAAAV